MIRSPALLARACQGFGRHAYVVRRRRLDAARFATHLRQSGLVPWLTRRPANAF
jgi:hypothetical protein